MTTKTAILLGLSLLVSANLSLAQTTPQTTPAPRGPMWQLTPEQQAERRQMMQTTLDQLRQKKTAGTITDTEKAWLDRVEQAGGWCVNGVPRGGCGMGFGYGRGNGTGPRAQMGLCPVAGNSTAAIAPASGGPVLGKGQAFMGGRGRGAGMGLPNGTGPRSLNGTCPLVNPPPAN